MLEETGIDHETPFLRDVLRLTESEEQMDAKLHAEAKELGINLDAFFLDPPKPLSAHTSSTEASRRSESIDSRASQLTGFTSNFSELSRDAQYGSSTQMSRASLSFRDYDTFLARGKPDGRNSMYFSPPSTPARSTFSLPLSSPSSSPKSYFRRIRGLGMLKLNKSATSPLDLVGCPHCPQDAMSQRRAVHKLPCGHTLCTHALRTTIGTATISRTGAIPSCCGVPIPGTMVEDVMTNDEQRDLLHKLEQWDEAASKTFSAASVQGQPSRNTAPGVISRTTSTESKVDSVAPQARKDLPVLHEREDFGQFNQGDNEQLERFREWMEKQLTELKSRHDQLRNDMRRAHENATDDLMEHHCVTMAEAEDKQVKAEADLREVQEQERRDNATALKHMEAYCAGTYSTGEPHNRTVTEQDLAELDKTFNIRDGMAAKHSSAINVLRGDQARRMRLRSQRQDREVQELRRAQRKEELELERACTNEIHRFEADAAEKRKKMLIRKDIQAAIVAKRNSDEISATLSGPFVPYDWNRETLAVKEDCETVLVTATLADDVNVDTKA